MVALLPEGAQVVVEVDLARLRASPVIGDLALQAAGTLAALIPGIPAAAGDLALTTGDAVVFAAYGVGTADAATVAVVATAEEITGGIRIGPGLEAFGADEWASQLATRAAMATDHPLVVPAPLRSLRARSVPHGATGAVVRIEAQLPFDARIAFARMLGFEAPAQLSLWLDIADDAALVLEADTTDPGTPAARDSGRRFAAGLRGALAALAELPAVRSLGIAPSLGDARLAVHGQWVRAVIAIGPRHLARVVERARAMLPPRHEAQ